MTLVLDPDAGLVELQGRSSTLRPLSGRLDVRTLHDVLGPAPDREVILLTGGADVIEEELIHRALTSVGLVRAVPRAAAAVCAVMGNGGAPSSHLVCDVGERSFTLAPIEVADGEIRSAVSVTEPGLGGRAFVEAVAAGCDPRTRADVGRALRERGGRLATVLQQASRHAFVREEQVAPGVTAGMILDVFAGFGERITAWLSSYAGAEPLLTGWFAEFPLISKAVADGAGRTPRTLGAEQLARGACDVAGGRVRLAAPAQVLLTMHRISAGSLEEVALPLPTGLGEFAQVEGRPLVLRKGASLGETVLPDVLPLLVRGERFTAGLAGLAPGDYRVGVRGSPAGLLFDSGTADPISIAMERQA